MNKILFTLILSILFSSSAIAEPDIDRWDELLYPVEGINDRYNVYVCLEDGYAYHHHSFCNIEEKLLGLTKQDFIKMTEYEAMIRGFLECPNCSDDLDYYDVDNLDNIEITVDDISEDLDDLIEFLISLFTQ